MMLSPWPISRSPSWVEKVNEPLTEKEREAFSMNVPLGMKPGRRRLRTVSVSGLPSAHEEDPEIAHSVKRTSVPRPSCSRNSVL